MRLARALVGALIRLVSILVSAVLLVFSLRRILFALAILYGRRQARDERPMGADADDWPDVLILAPCRDEGEVVANVGRALARLDYPTAKHRVVLIDDGSRDATGALLQRLARGRSTWSVLSLPTSVGKSSALNAALAQHCFGEIVYVFDADLQPEPDVLKRAVRHFDDPRVAAVTGRWLPLNPLASPSAFYSAVESHVHQMVTLRAKDRLGLPSALLGANCGYRRSALARCGGFRDGVILEDSDCRLPMVPPPSRRRPRLHGEAGVGIAAHPAEALSASGLIARGRDADTHR